MNYQDKAPTGTSVHLDDSVHRAIRFKNYDRDGFRRPGDVNEPPPNLFCDSVAQFSAARLAVVLLNHRVVPLNSAIVSTRTLKTLRKLKFTTTESCAILQNPLSARKL